MNEKCKRIRVSSRAAEQLKKLGFNWTCEFYFTDDKFSHYDPNRIILMRGERETNWNADEFIMFVRNEPIKVHNGTYYDNFREKDIARLFYSAPTLDEAQRWLREVKNIYLYAYPDFVRGSDINPVWQIKYKYKIEYWSGYYDTYEEALEAGIGKIAKLLIEKDEPTTSIRVN